MSSKSVLHLFLPVAFICKLHRTTFYIKIIVCEKVEKHFVGKILYFSQNSGRKGELLCHFSVPLSFYFL